MNIESYRPTAKIYDFSAYAANSQTRAKVAQRAAPAYNIVTPVQTVYSGAWYHDAAIKDDDRGRKG